MLTTRVKESIKTALAMVIAYGVALYMDWDKAFWAAFAVAFCSLATIGQSLNKAAMRMFGTFFGIAVAFFLMALFPQHRWLFILSISLWVSFCTYMMAGPRVQYFWHVSAFVCAVIAIDAGPDPVNAFTIGILRAKETALGILVYSLVAVFLWPVRSGPQVRRAARELASAQRCFLGALLDSIKRGERGASIADARTAEIGARGGFPPLLAAGETDDVEVREQRREWRQFQRLTTEIGERLEHASWAIAGLAGIDVPALLPALDGHADELDARLTQIQRMLGGEAPTREPAPVDLDLDRAHFSRLSPFQRAALTAARHRLNELERLTRELFACAGALGDFATSECPVDESKAVHAGFVLDPDRLIAAIRVFVMVWLAWLAVIFVPDLPGGTAMAIAAVSIGMALVTMPMVSIPMLYLPTLYGLVVSGIAYMFVMPHLEGYLQLGTMIFVITFGLCYVFYSPLQMLGRAIGLALFVLVAAIDNDQSYSFLSFSTKALMFPLIYLLFHLTAYVPVSTRPEQAFARLLGRFFRSCEYLTETLANYPWRPLSRSEQRRTNFHLQEIASLPAKIRVLAGPVAARGLEGTGPDQLQDLVTRLQTLSRAVRNLVTVRGRRHAPALVEALGDDVRSWRLGVQSVASKMARDPAYADSEDLRTRLAAVVARLEEKITGTVDAAQAGEIEDEEAESLYHLLGAYRGVSEALVDFAECANGIAWAPWREGRFA